MHPEQQIRKIAQEVIERLDFDKLLAFLTLVGDEYITDEEYDTLQQLLAMEEMQDDEE